jgi:phage-related minor tail protein
MSNEQTNEKLELMKKRMSFKKRLRQKADEIALKLEEQVEVTVQKDGKEVQEMREKYGTVRKQLLKLWSYVHKATAAFLEILERALNWLKDLGSTAGRPVTATLDKFSNWYHGTEVAKAA